MSWSVPRPAREVTASLSTTHSLPSHLPLLSLHSPRTLSSPPAPPHPHPRAPPPRPNRCQRNSTMPSSQSKEGGVKGFLTRAGKSFYAGGTYLKEKSWMAAKMAGNVGFVVATTSIVVLMPLIFEIMREGQVR